MTEQAPFGQMRVGAVIVAYHPDLATLGELLERLAGQLRQVALIDNSERPASLPRIPGGIDLIRRAEGRNDGVATALNLGMDLLRQAGCQRALLLDQDSMPPPDLIEKLARTLDQGQAERPETIAVGPMIRERGSRLPAPFIRFRFPVNRRFRRASGYVECDFLITSGCLVDLDLATLVGPMRGAWFIDNIDLEWSFRARARGFRLLGCADTELLHSIGERRRLPLALGHYRHHPPRRLYTMMRNRIFLYRSGAPIAWVAHDVPRLVVKLLLFSLIRPRRANLAAMLRGLSEGWRTRRVP